MELHHLNVHASERRQDIAQEKNALRDLKYRETFEDHIELGESKIQALREELEQRQENIQRQQQQIDKKKQDLLVLSGMLRQLAAL